MTEAAAHGTPGSLVPRIDVSPLLGSDLDTSASREVLAQLRGAGADVGFVTITGHGVARSRIDAALEACDRFFSLPESDKLEAAPRRWNPESPNQYRGYFPSSVEGKEGLDIGDPLLVDQPELLARPYHEVNRLPAALEAVHRRAIEDYFEALWSLGSLLFRAIVASVGGDPARVDAAFARPAGLSTLRFNDYPERDEPVAVDERDGLPLSCQAHVDSGFLTLLHQDDRGGLQVRGRDRRWHDVEPDADAFVVNTGFALERMTGGLLRATLHRVVYERRRRVSVPFFLEPGPDFAIDPVSLGLPFASDPAAECYEDFLRKSLAKFSEYER